MKIVIAGGSGFIGRKLTDILLQEKHEILILTRKEKNSSEPNVKYVKWLETGTSPEEQIERADVVINLAGTPINAGRWTARHQKDIYESRMAATNELLRITLSLNTKPSVFINASAIGIYPASLSRIYTEKSTEVADDFLGRTVHDWEERAAKAMGQGIRTVFLRFGVVLGREGGALPLMVLPYKLLAGGTIGSGKQWVSWVHIADVVRTIIFIIKNKNLSGPVNVTAPNPTPMKEFGQTIGNVLHRPHLFPVPAFVLKMALGEKSSLVLEGQRVVPEVLLNEGFEFQFPSLAEALRDLLL